MRSIVAVYEYFATAVEAGVDRLKDGRGIGPADASVINGASGAGNFTGGSSLIKKEGLGVALVAESV